MQTVTGGGDPRVTEGVGHVATRGLSVMNSRLQSWILVLAACVVAFSLSSAKAEPAKWNQKRVTSIAENLAVAVGELRDNVRKLPPIANSPQRKVRYQALDDLSTLKQVSDSLARALKAGKGREETYPTFRRIQTLQHDLEEHGRKADIKLDTLNAYAKVADLLRQISPYYEEEEKAGEGTSAPSEPPAPKPAPAPSAPPT